MVALLGSAGLFALIHIDTVSAGPAFYRLPFAFAVGLGLAALRLLTGSLIPSMVAHAVLNTITFATVFLSGAASEAMERAAGPVRSHAAPRRRGGDGVDLPRAPSLTLPGREPRLAP